jgi:asparagine synthase (glutamine-hydrolysing)
VEPGFFVRARKGQADFHLSPTTRSSCDLLRYNRLGHLEAVVFGRIYYPGDRLAELSVARRRDLTRSDQVDSASLALALYEECGRAGLERLEGDYSLVLWDSERQMLTGSRDPLGGYPLFWAEHDDAFCMSSSLDVCRQWLGPSKFDYEYFAEFLAIYGQRNEGADESTPFERIQRVPAGTIVEANLRTNRLRKRRFWEWTERIVEPASVDADALAEQYGALLRSAVRERIRGCTMAHFSGGMDSTSVAMLAREEIARGAGSAPLHVVSLVYEQLPKLSRERAYVEHALAQIPDAAVHRIVADGLLDYDSFWNAPWHDEPYPALWRMSRSQASVDAAVSAGASTILTGFGADELVNLQPYYLTDLVRNGKLAAAWSEAGRWARARNCSRWKILKPFALAPLAARLAAVCPIAGGSRSGRLTTQNDASVPPWVGPEFAARHRLSHRLRSNVRDVFTRHRNSNVSVTLSALLSRPGDVTRWSLAAPRGIAIAHPFLDPRLLSFGLGIQLNQRPEPEPLKPTLARAMRDRLPSLVTNRRSKGHFDEVYYCGLRKNIVRLESMVRAAPGEVDAIFDREQLIRCLEEASLAGPNARQLVRLNLSLCIIRWFLLWQQAADETRPRGAAKPGGPFLCKHVSHADKTA